MDNEAKAKPLPEKVMRRHAEMIGELLPDITQLVLEEGRPADGLLTRHMRAHKELGSRDRRFLSQAIFSYFRWYGWTVIKLGLPATEACLVGAALDSRVLDESFRYLEGRCSLPCRVEPLGDKSLDEMAAALSAWFGRTEDDGLLTPGDLVPAGLTGVIDPERIPACIEQFQKRPPTWIRARAHSDLLVEKLSDQDVPATIHPILSSAVSVSGGVGLTNLLKAHLAKFTIQDIASQCVGLVCDPQEGDDWWDCCAGAGGKTLHLMDLMDHHGQVLATDIRSPALKELKKRARKHGIRGIRTQIHNAVRDEPFKKTFDGILADAPCSGWGTWARNPDARWRTSSREVIQSAARQIKILNNAAWCVKPGGKLVYAACTFTRPETEEAVMNFLDHNAGFRLDPFPHPLTGEPTDGQVQIWPWEGPGDAMYIARFVRTGE